MLRFGLVVITALVVAVTGVAQAKVIEVTVSQVAQNAAIAKQKAIASAEQQAFTAYVTQNAPAKAAKILEIYSAEQISGFISGYEVADEKITDRMYRATMKVDVNEQAVGALFDTAKMAAAPEPLTLAERQDGAILVLPVTKNASGILLWESENQWRDVVNAIALQRGFGRLVLPYGDPTDRLMVDASNVTTAGFPLLSALARRYGASDILVAVLQPSIDTPSEAVQVDLRFVNAGQIKRQLVSVKADEKEGYAALLARTAKKIVDGLAKQAEREQRMANGDAPLARATLNAVLSLNNVRDWAELQERLSRVKAVESVALLSADWKEVTMALTYRGTPEMLGQQLAHANIQVQQGADRLRLAIR